MVLLLLGFFHLQFNLSSRNHANGVVCFFGFGVVGFLCAFKRRGERGIRTKQAEPMIEMSWRASQLMDGATTDKVSRSGGAKLEGEGRGDGIFDLACDLGVVGVVDLDLALCTKGVHGDVFEPACDIHLDGVLVGSADLGGQVDALAEASLKGDTDGEAATCLPLLCVAVEEDGVAAKILGGQASYSGDTGRKA